MTCTAFEETFPLCRFHSAGKLFMIHESKWTTIACRAALATIMFTHSAIEVIGHADVKLTIER